MDKRYPDLALLAQPARRAICCLAVEGGGEKIEGLLNRKPFSRYVENGLTVLLYDEAQSEAWRAEIERILAGKRALRGAERAVCAGRVRARAACPRRASRWKRAEAACARGARSTTWARTAKRRFCARRGRRSGRRASARRISATRRSKALARLDEQGGCAVCPQPARVSERAG